MKNYFTILAVFVFILYPLSAGAIPSLGVAPTSGGVYYYDSTEINAPMGSPEWEQEWEQEYGYLEYFADKFIAFGGDPGFVMPASGEELTVWYGSDNAEDDLDVDIYLATNSAAGDSFSFTNGGGGTMLLDEEIDGDKAGGYKPLPYYGVNLGSINDDEDSNWAVLSEDAGWSGTWYIYTGTILYSDFQPNQEDWMFVIADMDKDGTIFEKKDDEFSPKTSSSNSPAVPEPATMLLVGAGLIGMAAFGRKKFFKKA